jgi:TetR/AcrR family fatty acid metabolism transcriptional regulator
MRKKEGNKGNAILEAAIKIFAEKGFHISKIQNIAVMANIATGSVYLYYKSKEAILAAIFEQLWKKLYLELNSVAGKPDLSPTEKFDFLVDLLFDTFSENSALAIVFVNEQQNIKHSDNNEFSRYYNGFMELGEKIVLEGQEKNVFHRDVDVEITRIYVFGGLRLLVRQWAHDPENVSITKIRENVKNLTKHGLVK